MLKIIKYKLKRILQFIKIFIFDVFNKNNWRTFIKNINSSSVGVCCKEYDGDNICAKIAHLLSEGKLDEAVKLMSDFVVTAGVDEAVNIVDQFKHIPEIDIIKDALIWKIMHYRGMEKVITSFTPELLGSEKWKGAFMIPNPRIINAYGGEYFSIFSEGLSIAGVMENSRDVFGGDIECATKLSLVDSGQIDCLKNIEKKRRDRRKLSSHALSDTNSLDLSFQTTGLINGHIYGRSLWTRDSLASSHSFVVQVDEAQQPYVFVFFDDVEPWYLMVGSYRGTKNYIYLPGRNIVILLRSLDHEWYKINDYINGFHYYGRKNPLAFNRYLRCKTKSAVYSGGIKNLGHFFWNEVQGLFNAKSEGALDQVSEIVLYKSQYLDLENIFPEFLDLTVTKPANGDEVFVKCIERNLFCIHPTAFSMTSDSAMLIRETAWTYTDLYQKQLINQAQRQGIKFWFNLRSHNKVWLEQVEGVTTVCNYLHEKYGKVMLILDGLPDCNILVNEVQHKIGDKVTIVDCTNTTLENSISWACNVDFFVATIGSGLTINTWIAEKEGVAHSERSHLRQLEMWRDVRQDIAVPLVPKHSQIAEVSKQAYCNYSIDPDVILNLVKKIA
jgi:hypothetical protein